MARGQLPTSNFQPPRSSNGAPTRRLGVRRWKLGVFLRHLIICALLIALAAPFAHAQSPTVASLQAPIPPRLKINYAWASPPPVVAAALHPAAKGAAIGAGAGAATFAAFGLFYCTVGPNEVGECSNGGMWTRGLLVWGAVGAGVGALIGVLR